MKPKTTLLLIAAVCVVPALGAYLSYHYLPPDGSVNYGELIEPRELPTGHLRKLDGSDFSIEQLRGQWVMVLAESGACSAECEENLYFMRQVRKAQGEKQTRLERVWLLTDDAQPDARVQEAIAGTHIVRAAGSALLADLPAASAGGTRFFLVDPFGKAMMRYNGRIDPKRMIADLTRLLKYQSAG